MLLQLMVSPGPGFTQADAAGYLLALFKWLLVAVSFLYVLVSVIITRQIGLMRATVTTPQTRRLVLVSLIHLACAIVLLVYFVLFL
ncbi:hypothetical protein KC721_03625 [Candidatus Woesebacteria bacterium]|nr:hypothetical protein [Candidatus Woesebacteria bacterium]